MRGKLHASVALRAARHFPLRQPQPARTTSRDSHYQYARHGWTLRSLASWRHNQWQSFRGKRSGAKTRGDTDVAIDIRANITYTQDVKVKELLKRLHDDGWYIAYQSGSHIQLKHASKTGKVTVPNHKGDLPIKTVNSSLKQAGLK